MSQELWPKIHGSQFIPSPKCNIIYNILYSMGIYPNIEVFPLNHYNRFTTLDEGVEHFSGRVFGETNSQKAVIREYLKHHTHQDNGTIIIPGHSTRVRMWWEKKDRPDTNQ